MFTFSMLRNIFIVGILFSFSVSFVVADNDDDDYYYGCDWDSEEMEYDCTDFPVWGIVVLVIVGFLFLLGIPILLCFCCACCCFASRRAPKAPPTTVVVAAPQTHGVPPTMGGYPTQPTNAYPYPNNQGYQNMSNHNNTYASPGFTPNVVKQHDNDLESPPPYSAAVQQQQGPSAPGWNNV